MNAAVFVIDVDVLPRGYVMHGDHQSIGVKFLSTLKIL
jgi:hypothetical protein